MANFSPFDATLWYATAGEAPSTRPLDETVQADVCVVGAGYTGMTTALELARAGIKVVILEAEQAGFGGSGRNAGHCTPTFIHFSLPQLRKLIGEPWAERLIQRQTRAADRVADMIERYQIQCEWVRNGFVQAAAYPSAVETLRRKADDYNAVGARTRFVDRAEMEAITGSGRFHGGWVHEEAGHLNPSVMRVDWPARSSRRADACIPAQRSPRSSRRPANGASSRPRAACWPIR